MISHSLPLYRPFVALSNEKISLCIVEPFCIIMSTSTTRDKKRSHIQSGHFFRSLLPPLSASLLASMFGYPGSRYGADVTRSDSSICTRRSRRWHQGPLGPACTSPLIGTPSLPRPPGQNPRRICSLEPHCLPHWSMRLFKLVALPTFRLIRFFSSGSADPLSISISAIREVRSERTKDLKSVDIAIHVARCTRFLHLRTECDLCRRL